MSTKERDEQQMRDLLNDAVDLVSECADDGVDKVKMTPWARTEDRKGEMYVTSSTSQLPLGDLETHGCLLSLTKGANATVHSLAKAADQALS